MQRRTEICPSYQRELEDVEITLGYKSVILNSNFFVEHHPQTDRLSWCIPMMRVNRSLLSILTNFEW